VGAGCHDDGVGRIGGLAQFDVADIGHATNTVNLQLKLARVQSPEPFAETLTIATVDLGHPQINRSDVTAIVEVELPSMSGAA